MLTLSGYLPKNTEYFYSYPVGDTFHFYNAGDPINEELISARLLACAGADIKVVVYHSIIKNETLNLLRAHSDIPFIPKEQIIVLPQIINEEIFGEIRNELVTEGLCDQTSRHNLIMAQPILDDRLIDDYQIDPKLTIWLNDKKNLNQYVSSEFLPERYAEFKNGADLFNTKVNIPLPCVVKVSASSSGEGIRFCETTEDLDKAKTDFKERMGTLYIEKMIPHIHNIGFQFGIPFDKTRAPHIIGYNHQVTAADGEFLGGFIYKNEKDEQIETVKAMIEKDILPKIQAMGWYGVGGFDVLLNEEGRFYVIDSNFRTTGMTAYIFLTSNNQIEKSMVSFTATFTGNEQEYVDKILSLNQGGDKILTIISMTQRDNSFRFNAALLFNDKKELPKLATVLTERGVKSRVLGMLKKQI